jgi:LmbE family N-acetylglucosaminyl deacetylase
MAETPILVVAAHPDDEALGCGGAMARHASQGHSVAVLFLADGETARPGAQRGAIGVRRDAARRACAELGALDVRFRDFPDNRLDSIALLDVVQAIEAVVAEVRPSIVYTHFGGDLNVDHQIVSRAVMTACRPQPGHCVRSIRAFEVLSSTEWALAASTLAFRPTLFVDISPHLDAKLAALGHYGDEMRAFPHTRSMVNVVNLARLRGASVGLPAAEAFVVERQIE